MDTSFDVILHPCVGGDIFDTIKMAKRFSRMYEVRKVTLIFNGIELLINSTESTELVYENYISNFEKM